MINRRKYHRIPSITAPCKVKFRGETIDAYLIDESIEGLRIGNLELRELKRGEYLEVDFDGQSVKGRTRSVSPNTDETFQVGLQRETTIKNPVEEESRLLGHFVRFQNRWIACEILRASSTHRVRIRLLDGKELEIARNQIFQLSETSRREMLAHEEEFEEIQAVYRFMVPECEFEDVDSIIKQEYLLA